MYHNLLNLIPPQFPANKRPQRMDMECLTYQNIRITKHILTNNTLLQVTIHLVYTSLSIRIFSQECSIKIFQLRLNLLNNMFPTRRLRMFIISRFNSISSSCNKINLATQAIRITPNNQFKIGNNRNQLRWGVQPRLAFTMKSRKNNLLLYSKSSRLNQMLARSNPHQLKLNQRDSLKRLTDLTIEA